MLEIIPPNHLLKATLKQILKLYYLVNLSNHYPGDIKKLKLRLKSPNCYVIISHLTPIDDAEDQCEINGFLVFNQSNEGNRFMIDSLYVMFPGHGLGSRMVTSLHKYCSNLAKEKCIIYNSIQANSYGFWEKLGYQFDDTLGNIRPLSSPEICMSISLPTSSLTIIKQSNIDASLKYKDYYCYAIVKYNEVGINIVDVLQKDNQLHNTGVWYLLAKQLAYPFDHYVSINGKTNAYAKRLIGLLFKC